MITFRRLNDLVFLLLVSLALSVPVFARQPTKILCVLLVVATILHVFFSRGWRSWDSLDYAMTAMFFAATVSSLLAWHRASIGWQGFFEGLVFWTSFIAVRHTPLSSSKLKWLAISLLIGCLAGLLLAAYNFIQAAQQFELPGITGTIRSSLYIGMLCALCIGLARKSRGLGERLGWSCLAVSFGVALLALSSRAVGIATVLTLLTAFWWRSRRHLIYFLVVTAIIAAIAPMLLPAKQQHQLAHKAQEFVTLVSEGKISPNDAVRIETWRIAWDWMRRGEHVFFGLGPRNFHLIPIEELQLDPPLQFDESKHMSHAHNMFMTMYIEQGLFGLLALVVVLTHVAHQLWKTRITPASEWSWWGGWAALLLLTINGLVGSPWGREYTWLACMLFAIHLAHQQATAIHKPTLLEAKKT